MLFMPSGLVCLISRPAAGLCASFQLRCSCVAVYSAGW